MRHLALLFRYILLPKQKERELGMCKLPLLETSCRSWAGPDPTYGRAAALHTPADPPGCRLPRDIPWNAPSLAGSCVMHKQPGLLPGHRAGISRGMESCHGLAACASITERLPAFPFP